MPDPKKNNPVAQSWAKALEDKRPNYSTREKEEFQKLKQNGIDDQTKLYDYASGKVVNGETKNAWEDHNNNIPLTKEEIAKITEEENARDAHINGLRSKDGRLPVGTNHGKDDSWSSMTGWLGAKANPKFIPKDAQDFYLINQRRARAGLKPLDLSNPNTPQEMKPVESAEPQVAGLQDAAGQDALKNPQASVPVDKKSRMLKGFSDALE